ncbi:glutamate--cysteine ligase [Nonomuraea spiralis]|uniref:Putative glutamate--cysteine ligase 2 n=1 Tax=Nonomuraea spiralis TaxID=46182 RepID=A0ABV5IUS1_9ACTN|nr:glutamate--cysteine ligase [Nonomuraea spiralis]GGS92103.1 putative glutamate--cysteine ligase 2 [Nonomuraea spiralis]
MTATAESLRQALREATARLMGVEEEYLVVDPVTRAVAPRAAAVVGRAAASLGERVCTEITQFQVEAKTTPCASRAELDAELRRMREVVAAAAREEGLAVVASGTPVIGDVVPPPITEHPRYGVGIENYRALHDEQAICAGHVHIHVPDREQAVLVCNHVRPWLPVLLALMANSPFWSGRDTGYAGWRILAWSKWPVAGPPPYFGSLEHFERTVAALTASGALVDPGTLFWDVRPSARLPTVEVRVGDVPASTRESVFLALVVRALVTVSLRKVEDGDPGPEPPAELLRVAYWRAARDGLGGFGVDPFTGAPRPVAELVEELLDHVGPALAAAGDLEAADTGWRLLREGGSGADRQRAAHARRGALTDVVDDLAARFTSND